MRGFVEFVRAQGVVGLAIGFILGGAISKVVTSLVNDIINPLVGIITGVAGGLDNAVFKIGSAEILIGMFLSNVIDFMIIAAIVYFGFKSLRLERLDKKNQPIEEK